MHLAPLLADVTFSPESLVVVIAVVAALWAWSVTLVQARARDLIGQIQRLQIECNQLRRQNEGLYGQLLEVQRELATLKAKLPGA
jgi:cell division protein FtsL